MKHATIILAILALVSLGGASQAFGDTTWTAGGGAGSTLFSNASNWDSTPIFSGTNNFIFATSGTVATWGVNTTVGNITFNADSDFALSGVAGRLTIAGSITVSSTNAHTYSILGTVTWPTTIDCTVSGGSILDLQTLPRSAVAQVLSVAGTGIVRARASGYNPYIKGITVGDGATLSIPLGMNLHSRTSITEPSFVSYVDGTVDGSLYQMYGDGTVYVRGNGKLINCNMSIWSTYNLTLDNSGTNLTDRVGSLGGSNYLSMNGKFKFIGNDTLPSSEYVASFWSGAGGIMEIEVNHGLTASATVGFGGYSITNANMFRISGTDLNGPGPYTSAVTCTGLVVDNGIAPAFRIGNDFVTTGTVAYPMVKDGTTSTVNTYALKAYTGTIPDINNASVTQHVFANLGGTQALNSSKTVGSLKLAGDSLYLNDNTLSIGGINYGGGLIATGTAGVTSVTISGGTIQNNGAKKLFLSNDVDLTISATIATGVSLSKIGTGKLILSGQIPAGMPLMLAEGSLEYRSPSANTVNVTGRIGGTNTIYMNSPGMLAFNGNYWNGSSGGVVIDAGTIQTNNNGYGCENALGTGITTVNSSGTLWVAVGELYNQVDLNSGTLLLVSGVGMNASGTVNIPTGQIGVVQVPTWTTGKSYISNLTGSGTLRKIGTGNLVFTALTASSSFSGDLLIEDGYVYISDSYGQPRATSLLPGNARKIVIGPNGKLWADSSSANRADVLFQTLEGTGTVLMNSTTSGSGTAYPLTSRGCTWRPGGDSVGTLTVNGNLTFSTTTVSSVVRYNTLSIDIGSTGNDRLVLTATTTVAGLVTSLTNCQLSFNVSNGLDLSGQVYTFFTTNSNLTTAGVNTRFGTGINYGSNILASSATVQYGAGFALVTNLQYAPGLISGLKFSDSNANGTQDAGEPALANWPINLTIGGVTTPTFTDGTGAFSFSVSTSNSVPYTITEGSQTGWRQTSLITSFTGSVGPGETRASLIFGNQQLSALSGMKFNDANHNGVKDTGEVGLEGWTISLFNNSGTLTAVTDTNGAYSFANVIPGSYTLTETGSTGWTQSFPASGSWAGTVDSGATLANLDFGNYVAVTDIPGDINRDHIVDQADYTVWYNHYGQTPATWADGDVTGDNIVDQADYTVWYNHYGQTGGNVPEPMTMALLAIGGLAMLRRRK